MHELRCLGEATLRSPTGELIHFRSRKHLALLIYLALNTDRAHRRERLAGLLWSESEDSKARHSLSQALYAVRRLLDGAVRIEGEDLEFTPEGVSVDVLELERTLESGDAATAADLYRGDFLEGFWVRGAQGFDEWIVRERSRVGALAREALRQAIGSARDRCHWSEVQERVERLVRLDPFDEAAYAEWMRALWMMGDRAGALDRYEQLKRMLAEELNTQPSIETDQLADRIRRRPVRGGWDGQRLLRESESQVFRDPPFIGRKRQLATLAQEWRFVKTGESRTVALVGSAGIGKTRLANEFIKSLELDDVTVMRGRCYEAEQGLPYGPLAEALRLSLAHLDLSDVNGLWLAELARIVPEVREQVGELPEPPELEAEGGRRRLYEGIAQVLRSACEARPLLLFIDDLHWADDSSLALIHYVHRRVNNGLYLLSAYRPEELTAKPDSAAAKLLSGGNPQITTLPVEGLDRAESSDLLTAVAGQETNSRDLRSLQDMSAGNPFFAIELARNLIENSDSTDRSRLPVPQSIKAIFDRRFTTLSDRAIGFVQQAAFLGSRIRYEVLRHAVGLSPLDFEAALRDASRAGILTEVSGEIRFRHDLIREVTKEQVPEPLRNALHLKAARALIRNDGSAGDIAFHFSSAGDRRRAHAYALRGADSAERVYAFEEAAELLELAVLHAPTERVYVELLGRLGRTCMHVRAYTKARKLLGERVEYLLNEHYSERERIEGRLDHLIAGLHSSTVRLDEAQSKLAALYEELRSVDPEEDLLPVEILQTMYWTAARRGDRYCAERAITELRKVHRGLQDPACRWRTERMLGIHECYSGNLVKSEKLLREALQSAREEGSRLSELTCYIGLSVLAARNMSNELCEEILHHAVPIAEECGDPGRKPQLLSNCAISYIERRDLDRAKALLADAQQGLRGSEFTSIPGSIHFNLGDVAFLDGDYSTAESEWKEALDASEKLGMQSLRLEALASLGTLALRRGHVKRARALAAQALRLNRQMGIYVDKRHALETLLARLRVMAGQSDKAMRRLAEMVEWAKSRDIALYLSAQLCRLELLMDQEPGDRSRRVQDELCDFARTQKAEWWVNQAESVQVPRSR